MHLWLMAQGPGGDLLPSSCELPAHVPAPCDAGPCARLVWPAQPALASCQTQCVRSILHTIVLLGMLGSPVHCLCSSTALCAVLQPSPALHITGLTGLAGTPQPAHVSWIYQKMQPAQLAGMGLPAP